MGTPPLFYLTCLLYLVIVGWVIVLSFSNRYRQPGMAGMVGAMSVGMVVGVTIGASAPILWDATFFSATVIGVVTGASSGLIVGWGSGLVGILDGLLSGVMGGMMGAMLGVMVSVEEQHTLFHLLMLFSGGSLFLVFLLLRNKRGTPHFGRLDHLPTYALLICLFIIAGYLTPLPKKGVPFVNEGGQMMQITITARASAFMPSEVRLEKNKPVRIQLHNQDIEAHGLEWQGYNGAMFRLYAKPGEKVEGVFTPQKTGTFFLGCMIPGHREAGMTMKMEIED